MKTHCIICFYDQPRPHIKKQRHYFVHKGLSSEGSGFSSGHVWMWELDYKESWAPKNWCFWTVVLEKTLESPLDCQETQPVHLKGDQSCVFIGGTGVEAETPILQSPDVKSWLIWKDPDAGKDWRQEEKGMTEDEMVGWHHQLSGHGFGWTPGVGDGQGGLALQRVRHDWATELNWTETRKGENCHPLNSIWEPKSQSIQHHPREVDGTFSRWPLWTCGEMKSQKGQTAS